MDMGNNEVLGIIKTKLDQLSRLQQIYHIRLISSMDGVEASRIIEATLAEISKRHHIDLSQLRDEHRLILVALQKEANGKAYAAEERGYNRGKLEGISHEISA